MIQHLHVANFSEYQNFKAGTRPDWIKAYIALLNPAKHPGFAKLSDGAKLTLHHLRLLAGDCDNLIPYTWLTRERLNMQTRPKVEEVIGAGFASWCSVSHSKAKIADKDKDTLFSISSDSVLAFDQEGAFATFWDDCRKTRVPDPKHKPLARKYFFGSVRSELDLSRFCLSVANYRASKRVANGNVQDASTFVHDWQSWEDEKQAPSKGPDGLAITDDKNAAIDEAREFILASRISVRLWKSRGAKPEEWPLSGISPAEWEEFEAWRGDAVKSLDEFFAQRMVTA